LPPTFAAPIWPAAGIAVGVLILWGYKYIPAILIGEILINLKFYKFEDFNDQPTLYFTYALLLIATIIRSALGSYLVKRELGKSNNFFTMQSIAKLFLLAGLIPTFLSTAISTFVLAGSNLLDKNTVLINFATWWFGDSVGIFIVLPLMFVIFKKPRKIWQSRLLKTLVPVCVTFILLIVIALNLKQSENKRIVRYLDNQVVNLFDSVLKKFVGNDFKNPHDLHTAEFNQIVVELFKKYTRREIINQNLQDIHFIIYNVLDNSKTKIFESDNIAKRYTARKTKREFEFANFKWDIIAYTTPEYYVNKGSWLIWWLLSIGFLFTSFLGAGLLVLTGNTILIKHKVVERTKEINTLNKILIESENRYKKIIEVQPVIFWTHIIGETKLNFVSDEAVNILGYKKEELLDFEDIWHKMLHPLDRARVAKEYFLGIKTKKRFTIKYRAICKNGEVIWFKDFISYREDNGNIEVVGLKINITKDEIREQKIKQLAYYDTMTKLPNRVRFMAYLKDAISKSLTNQTFGAVLYLDLDRFKVLNDSMGHYFGDKLLVQISDRLRKSLDNKDISSRFGGDEFVILIGSQEDSVEKIKHEALHVSELINNFTKEPFNIDGYSFSTTFSTGISIFPHHSKNADEIILQADIAMYASKEKGKNTISLFKKEMQQEASKRLHVEKSLKTGLLRHEFEMYYQPIFDKNKNILKLESLVRWNHPKQGLLLPNSFIKIAEETGFIIELSEWIIDDVFSYIDQTMRSGKKILPISINISLFQFLNTGLIEVLKSCSQRYGIDNSLITLELTESIGIENFDDALKKLQQLKALGFDIAIDDFGTGYSSLNYLTQMPIDTLKLDKTFVHKIGKETNSETLIETIILMANQLNLDIVVEGVETEEQLDFLINLGCETFQGHLFSHALPVTELDKVLAS
jgi:diguanylate cyclase (GGDEF)-like protein/PAS domain S-box-containing protein